MIRGMQHAWLPSALFALLLSAGGFAACSDDPPDPGFEDGEGGAGGEAQATTGTNATSVTTGTTATTGPTATSSAATSTSTSSTTTSTGSLGCNDLGVGEPNNTESTAHDLGTIGDSDSEGGSVSGMVAGPMDVDWYKYLGEDNFGSVVDPTRTLSSSHPVRICKFFQCLDNAANDFSCPNGTTDATSPDGRPGCCGTAGFDVSLSCGSSSLNSDDAWVYIRIDSQQNQCVTYTLGYHY